MDVKQAVSRALLGAGLLLAAPALAACGGEQPPDNSGSGVGRDVGGGSPIMEATGRAEDTGDRAGHGAGEAGEHTESGEGTG